MIPIECSRFHQEQGWEEHLWGNSLSFSPHIVCCLQSLAQRNLNKGVRGGRFGHFLFQLSFSLRSDFSPLTFNLCSCRACKSFHERGFIILPQRNFKVGLLSFGRSKYQPHQRRWGVGQSLSKSFQNQYEKLRLLKPHYLTIKTQKKFIYKCYAVIHWELQLLCNYLFRNMVY